MSSIGILVRAEGASETLGEDWIPEPLGPRWQVEAALAELLGDTSDLRLNAHVDPPGGTADPRTISFSGVWGDAELAVLRTLCQRFEARFFDAETGAFLDL
jgi:hypothetical protein